MIFETIITTQDAAGAPHVAPFGVRYDGAKEDIRVVISPYKPSTTLDNILTTKNAVMNMTDDVRFFAAAVTNRKIDNFVKANKINGFRLVDSLAHMELALIEVRDDAIRPQLIMKKIAEFNHKPYAGFNRAQAAVIELAVLVSRLHLLPKDKIMNELQYLKIAIDKTAGERELQAWSWLTEAIDNFYAEQAGANQA